MESEAAMNETREIPRDDWAPFFTAFTRRNAERPASVQVLSRDIGAQYEARRLALQGIFLERGLTTITIVLGRSPQLVEHPVASPRRVWVETSDSGYEAVEIEAADDTKTIVELARN
jgi:hypothetical protein